LKNLPSLYLCRYKNRLWVTALYEHPRRFHLYATFASCRPRERVRIVVLIGLGRLSSAKPPSCISSVQPLSRDASPTQVVAYLSPQRSDLLSPGRGTSEQIAWANLSSLYLYVFPVLTVRPEVDSSVSIPSRRSRFAFSGWKRPDVFLLCRRSRRYIGDVVFSPRVSPDEILASGQLHLPGSVR